MDVFKHHKSLSVRLSSSLTYNSNSAFDSSQVAYFIKEIENSNSLLCSVLEPRGDFNSPQETREKLAGLQLVFLSALLS